MTQPNEDLVRAASAAFGRGDLATLRDQFFADNIVHDVLASADHTVALTTIRAERAGKQLQLNVVHVIHADNGKATEVWTHTSDPAAAAQFWS